MGSLGFTMPFAQATGSLGLFVATQSEVAAAKHDLRSLLLTNWGERPMHRDLGCNLIEFLFQQMIVGETDVLVEERIRSQVSKWLPFLAIKAIKVTFPEDRPNTIRVDMKYFLISKPEFVEDISAEVTA